MQRWINQVLPKAVAAAALLTAALPLSASGVEPTTTIYRNGKIYTGGDKAPWADTLVIKGENIAFVGQQEAIPATVDKNASVVDLAGRFVMPGIVDAHTHPGLVAILGEDEMEDESTDFPPMPSKPKEAILEWLRKYKEANPDAEAVIAGEWDIAEFMPEGPNKADLDAIFPETPVLLFDNSGHGTWINSAMMAALGVSRDTKDLSKNISYLGY
jgi:predicted amidohydrolase YtcJ